MQAGPRLFLFPPSPDLLFLYAAQGIKKLGYIIHSLCRFVKKSACFHLGNFRGYQFIMHNDQQAIDTLSNLEKLGSEKLGSDSN